MRPRIFLICVLFVYYGKAEPATNVTIDDNSRSQRQSGDKTHEELPENTLEHDIATVLKELNLIGNSGNNTQTSSDLPSEAKWNVTKDFPTDLIKDDMDDGLQTPSPPTIPTFTEGPYHYAPPRTSGTHHFHEPSPWLTTKPFKETSLNTLNYYVPLHSHVASKPQTAAPPQQPWVYKPQSSYEAPYVPASTYYSGQPSSFPSQWTSSAIPCPCSCNQQAYTLIPNQAHYQPIPQYRTPQEHQYEVKNSGYTSNHRGPIFQ